MRFTTCFVLVLAIGMTVYGENSPATQALFKACQVNNLPQIQKSIEEGADVNAANEQGVLPLFYAVWQSNTQAVDLLLNKGAKIDTPTQSYPQSFEKASMPPVMWAAYFKKKDMVSHLISKGAAADVKDSNGVHLVCLAVRLGDTALLDTLDQKGVKFDGRFILGKEETGSLLHCAIETGSVPMLTYLLQKKIDIELRDGGGNTPLLSAAYSKNLEMVKLLVAQGADIHATCGYGKTLMEEEPGRLSPLIQNYLRKVDREAKETIGVAPWAAMIVKDTHSAYLDWNQFESYLQQNGDVRGTDSEGNTLLHYVADIMSVETSKPFPFPGGQSGGTVPKPQTYNQRHYADEKQLGRLVSAGLDVNAKNVQGETPLHWAARRSDANLVKFLLEHGADVKISDKEGNTPLNSMANWYFNGDQQEQIAILNMLLEQGADINTRNTFGMTPIIKISESNMDNHAELIKLLIDKGADIHAQSGDLQTALHAAADMGTPKTVKMLLEAGASVSVKDIHGQTPLGIVRYDPQEKLAMMFPYKKDACILDAVLYGQLGEIEKLAATGKDGIEHIHPNWNYDVTPLVLAAWKGDLKCVEKLIDLKANVNARDSRGNTALHLAAENGYDDIVYALLQAGANPVDKNKEGKTAQELAAAQNHLRTVQIIKENSSSEPKQVAKQSASADKTTVDSIEAEDPNEILQRVIERRQEFAERLRSNSNKPIQQAVLMEKIEFVKQLLAQDKSIAGKTDGAGMLPLTYAALTGSKEMVTLLLDNGADINQLDENSAFSNIAGVQLMHSVGTKAGFAALHYLAATEDVEMVEFILSKGADVNIKDAERQNSPVWIAKRAENIAMMKTLISHGAKLDQYDLHGDTLINNAAQNGEIKSLETLLALGADINTRDKSGSTPLLSACIWGQKDAVLYLIEKGADLKAVNQGGEGALHIVISEKDGAETIRILLEHGIDVNQKDNAGNVPIFSLERVGRQGGEIKEGHIENFKMLIEAGADIKARNKDGDSILHIAVNLLSLDIAKIAVKQGADVNWKNNEGQTPLSRAIGKACMEEEHGQFGMIQYLVDQGADVKWRDGNGPQQTLLHIAADRKKTQIVKILLEHGAEVNTLDKFDRTPLHYATSGEENIEIIRLLLNAGARYDLKDLYGRTAIKNTDLDEAKGLFRQLEEKKQ